MRPPESQRDSPLHSPAHLPSEDSGVSLSFSYRPSLLTILPQRTVVPHDPSAHQHGKREANDPAVNREWTWDNYTIGGPAGQPSTARDDAAGLASASSLALPPEVTFGE